MSHLLFGEAELNRRIVEAVNEAKIKAEEDERETNAKIVESYACQDGNDQYTFRDQLIMAIADAVRYRKARA